MKERFPNIDFLRAFSIGGVMIIHTLSFSLGSPLTFFFWNFLQFVVAVFIFCSGFVHGHYSNKLDTFSVTLSWYKKRATRILFPFYIYFFVHFSLFYLFPTNFTHFGLQKNIPYFIGSIFLFGGINASWLPLLFLELTLLTPFFFLLIRKNLMWVYLIVTGIVVTIATVWFFPYFWYRGLMWIGWSLVFLLGLFASKGKSTGKFFASLAIIGCVLFSFLFFLFSSIHHSLNFTDNKYPPNWYYLSYAIAMTSGAFLLSKKIILYIPQWTYEYISKKSYSLFFIHYIVLDYILSIKKYIGGNIFLQILLVIGISLGIRLLLDTISWLTSKKARA